MGARITVKSNGSIKAEGDFELYDMEGNKFDLGGRIQISLCRCGHSNDKPFCDGSHRPNNFQSEIKASVLSPIKPKT
jgi:CDGSH-type Zn-finger protein